MSESKNNTEAEGRKGFADINEAAHYLRVSTKQIRRFKNKGYLRTSLVLRKIIIPWEDLESFASRTCNIGIKFGELG